jgi:hypothetical protein
MTPRPSPADRALADLMTNGHVRQIEQAANLVIRPRHIPVHKAQAVGEAMFDEIGTTGLRQYGGFVIEEWLNQLAGRRAAWVWREMQDNDPIIGAILFAIKWLARGVDWRVEEGNDKKTAEFVEQCMHDMSHTWADVISEVLSMLPYGYSYHELVYKRRNGPQAERPAPTIEDVGVEAETRSAGLLADTQEDTSNPGSSDYDDGKIGWRKIPVRAQETLLRWHFDGYSGIQAFEQIDWHGGNHVIPIQKALLFRTQTTRNNPEGRSMLRNAYTSYYAIKNIKTVETIGIERDLAGIPVMTPPPGVDLFSPANVNLLAQVQQMVTSIRRDEYEGIVLPSADWKLELLSAAGSRQIDTDAIIRRYRQDIAVSVLADFVLIGMDSVGSYAMVDIKSDLFGIAVDAVLDVVCDVFNRYAIPRLLTLNGMDASKPPRIDHASAGRIDVEKIGQFLYNLSTAQAPIPWTEDLLRQLFLAAGLPANFDTSKTPIIPVAPIQEGANQNAPARAATRHMPVMPATLNKDAEGDAVPLAPRQDPQVTDALHERYVLLSVQLEREIGSLLAELGTHAQSAYLTHGENVQKAQTRLQDAQRMVRRVLQALNLRAWLQDRLMPVLRNHAGRVISDTQRTIQTELGLEVQVGERDAEKIAASAGEHLQVSDIEPQIRQAIMDAIRQGLAAGENPQRTANRIRDNVPAGRFVNAGPAYRAQLISRNETADLQRASTLAAYKSNPNITAIRLRDGIYGPPRSDQQCMDRDGEVVPIDQADEALPFHPLCTLSFSPIVTG